MPRQTVVVVTGSREWSDRDSIRKALSGFPFGTILIHGDCRGADTICAYEGGKKGFKLWPFPYCEDDNGQECRNESMAAVAAVLKLKGHRVVALAFPLPGAIGTWKCVKRLKEVGIVAEVVRA